MASLGSVASQAEQLASAIQLQARLGSEGSAVLKVLDQRLAGLNKQLAPIHDRATTLTWAEQNINRAKAATDELLQFLDTSRKVLARRPQLYVPPATDHWGRGGSQQLVSQRGLQRRVAVRKRAASILGTSFELHVYHGMRGLLAHHCAAMTCVVCAGGRGLRPGPTHVAALASGHPTLPLLHAVPDACMHACVRKPLPNHTPNQHLQVEAQLRIGPQREALDPFLAAVLELEACMDYLQDHAGGLRAAQQVSRPAGAHEGQAGEQAGAMSCTA